MLQHLVSRGQSAFKGSGLEVHANGMSPSPGREPPSHGPQDKTAHDKNGDKSTGGLASVFKGLANAAKLSKPAATTSGPGMSAQIAEQLNDANSASQGLPPSYWKAFEQLKNGNPSDRVAAAQQLRYAVCDYPLNPVLDIWYAGKDLIKPENDTHARFSGWELLRACVKHMSSTDLERKEFFQTISAPSNQEDFHLQLACLLDLTRNGRNVAGFDYEVFPLLTGWLSCKFRSVKAARKLASSSRNKGKAAASGEFRDFADLFAFTKDVIKFNFGMVDDQTAKALVDTLLAICMTTGEADDLRACIEVLDAIVTYGYIPNDKLKDCIHVLSSTHNMVPTLAKESWHTLSILCRSHNGQAVLRILVNTLRHFPDDSDRSRGGIRNVRGALSVLLKLVNKSSEKGYPSLIYSDLVQGLDTVAEATSAGRVHDDILRLVNALFTTPDSNVNALIAEQDWTELLHVAATCAKPVIEALSSSSASGPVDSRPARDNPESTRTRIAKEISTLISRLEQLLSGSGMSYSLQRQECILFFIKVHKILPDSTATVVLDYFKQFRCCFPSDPQWEENLKLALDVLFADRGRSTQLRQQALRVATEVYDMVELLADELGDSFVLELVKTLLNDITEESDIELVQDVISFVTAIADTATPSLFNYIIETLMGVIRVAKPRPSVPLSSRRSSGISLPPDEANTENLQSPSNVVTRALVGIFMRVMSTDATKASRIFQELLVIVSSSANQTDARLSAMKLLFRLRADWANRIFITPYTELTHLAAALYRTNLSLSKKQAEEAANPSRLTRGETAPTVRPGRGISISQGSRSDHIIAGRPASGLKNAPSRYQPLWSADDPSALPEPVSQSASPVLYSYHVGDIDTSVESECGDTATPCTLPTERWLDVLVSILAQTTDWEVYSFILVHLPTQLSNHGIFKNAVLQLQEFRRILCEQIRNNGFQEPPITSGLRRADVVICLYQTLTMLMSYHEHFQKAEEDDIVSTFVRGITTWERSAKGCIHALTICCYELPMSTSKALVTILQKMATIVTQPSVAMHILEFLAGLARLPPLYVNFREEEYRIVFGICFRYLQYVRDKKKSVRISSASDSSPNVTAMPSGALDNHGSSADDLPQYVYALAYHVIIFWFLALKLPDRANHVGWIAKSLFTDVDGSQMAEEQAQITIDFMQRIAFADRGESAADSLFTADRFGEIRRRRWLIGNSIVTVEQAISSGWAQIIKRQPSGTSFYMIRELVQAPPAHQERGYNDSGRGGSLVEAGSVLPNHLLVQLLSSTPQCTDQARPLPLPDDDIVNRAIRMFDHSSTVDGHKVGVVYIGENQTTEKEILANISGSADYIRFLNGLGTLTRLKNAKFNTQGLDRQHDTDGQYTMCWRDKVSEMVFHVTTQMPTNLEHDPGCTLKKRHIGNDFVNIIFNDSGLPFRFDTFPSEFNYVNIVIAPESRASFVTTRQQQQQQRESFSSVAGGGRGGGGNTSFYKVQVLSKPGFPEISPASDTKIVSLKALPDFVRHLALNASVFSLVWAQRDGGEHISSWRNRLREINRLRDKYTPQQTARPPASGSSGYPGHSPPGTAHSNSSGAGSNAVRESFTNFRRSSVATFFTNANNNNNVNAGGAADPHSQRSSVVSTVSTADTEVVHANGLDFFVETLDFSKWA